MLKRRSFLLTLLSLSGSLSGCAFMRNLVGQPAPPLPPILPDDATLEQVVFCLNENTEKLKSWWTTKAKISIRGQPISADAMIAVEAPRNFRLIAKSPMGKEADFGSNDEQFWFWTKQNNDEKRVFTARHDRNTARMQHLPIPFQPDWIMEVMGVIPIDIGEVRMERNPPGSHMVTLISDSQSPQGYLVRKLTLVDLQNGVIRERGLYNSRSQLIAKAVLNGYVLHAQKDAPSLEAAKVKVPTQIEIHWQEAQLDMTVGLGGVEVNPGRIPGQPWTLQEIEGYSVWDLSR